MDWFWLLQAGRVFVFVRKVETPSAGVLVGPASSKYLGSCSHLNHIITKELAEEMMSEVSSCIDEPHDGKMNCQEVGAMVRKVSVYR
jgi:hypothetical protein